MKGTIFTLKNPSLITKEISLSTRTCLEILNQLSGNNSIRFLEEKIKDCELVDILSSLQNEKED